MAGVIVGEDEDEDEEVGSVPPVRTWIGYTACQDALLEIGVHVVVESVIWSRTLLTTMTAVLVDKGLWQYPKNPFELVNGQP